MRNNLFPFCRKLLLAGFFFCAYESLFAQNIAINTTGAAANSSALLHIGTGLYNTGGDTKGILIPRVALSATNNTSPILPAPGLTETGLMVYNTATAGSSPNNVVPGYYYWNGVNWVSSGGSGGLDWSLLGNAGTSSATNFIGTTDANSLVFKTNNTEWMRLLGVGTLKLTGTTTTSPGIWMDATVSSAAGTAYGILSRGTLTAAVNGDKLIPFSTNLGVVSTGAFTGLTFYGGHFEGSSWSKTGTGTIDNGYGIYVTTPTIATSNYAAAFTGGNVGIGTTSPNAKLQIENPNAATALALELSNSNASNVSGEGVYQSFNVGSTVNEMGRILGANYTGGSLSNGYLAFYTRQSDIMYERLRIDYDGNVGIGTTTPATILHVISSTSADPRGITDDQYSSDTKSSQFSFRKARGTFAAPSVVTNGDLLGLIKFRGYDGASFGDGMAQIEGVTSENWSGTNHGADLLFSTTPNGGSSTPTERVRITNSGSVGIGTATPGISQTYVANSGTSVGLYVGNGTPFGQSYIEQDGPAATHIWVAESGTRVFSVASGGAGYFAGSVTASCGVLSCSDIRYKTNIKRLENSLSKILLLEGVSYNWKTKEFPNKHFSNDKQIGFIAQEMEKIYPELVTTDADGYKLIDYSRLTPILVEAIKEQQKLIEEQKKTNDEQQQKIDALEKAVFELQMNSALSVEKKPK